MRKELTNTELEDERVELLPTRETLHFFGVNIWASNSSLALNVATVASLAESAALQSISVG